MLQTGMTQKNNNLRGRDYFLPTSEYDSLLKQVKEKGCCKNTDKEFFLTLFIAFVGIGISAYIITVTDSLLIQILNGFFAGFLTVQIGLISHDLSHKSVFKSKKINQMAATMTWGIGCGLSEERWFEKHNKHHQSPNHIGHDPDVEIPFVFEDEQIESLSTFQKKYLLPNQHVLFWIGIWLVYLRNVILTMKHILNKPTLNSFLEIFYILIHFAITLSFSFWFLPPAVAILFNLSVALATGVYMALIFAPNHKGEDMLESENEHNWVQQITFTRNIIPSTFVTYVFGGLNYQIEHHLFPTMSRFNYPQAQLIVKKFCNERSIPYTETTWRESLKEIHAALKKVSQGAKQ